MRATGRFLARNARLLAFGVLLTAVSSFGQTFFIGLFAGDVRTALGLSAGQYGGVYALATVGSALSLIKLGALLDRFSLAAYTAGALGGLSVACLAFAGLGAAAGWLALPAAVLGLYLLRLCGQGLMPHVAQTTMGRLFHHARGKAVAIAIQGHALGEALLPAPAVLLAGWLGWRGAWLGFAAVVAGVVLPAALALLRRERPSYDPPVGGGRAGPTGPELAWRRGDVLRQPAFYLVLPAILGPAFINTAVFFHQPALVAAKGWPLSFFAGTFAVYAGASIAASLGAGPLVDRLGARRLVPWHLVPMLAGLPLLAGAQGLWVAPVYMAAAGASTGLHFTLMGAYWPERYGTDHLGAIRSLVQACMVGSTALAPVAAGALLDLGVAMPAVVLALAGYLAVSLVLAAPGR